MLTRLFYRNLRLLILTIVLLVVWGIASFQALPQQEDPSLIVRQAVVKTPYPGANASQVEGLVTEALESELSEINGFQRISSTSRIGFSTIILELSDRLSEAEPVWTKVRDRLEQVRSELPSGAGDPQFDQQHSAAYTLIPALQWEQNENPNYGILGRYAKQLAIQLREVSGTEEVTLFGSPSEQIHVDINASDLVALGLSPQTLADRIRASDAKIPAGQFRNAQRNLTVEVENQLDTVDQIRQVPIQTSQQGQFTLLDDIATVERGIREPPRKLAYVNGDPAIALGVLMRSGYDIHTFSPAIRKELEQFRQQLPHGIALNLIFDQRAYVSDLIDSLMFNLLLAAILVMAMVFLAMGWRSSIVVGIALPLTVFAVLGGMSILGIAVHQISVTGLIIALGLLIDNPIVVVNEVQSELEAGTSPLKAVSKTVRYLWIPLLASTITTIMTFLPIALLPGPTGEFVGSVAQTVILALIFSLALALTIVVTAVAKLRGIQSRFSTRWWEMGVSFPALTPIYRWSLRQTTRKPLAVAILIGLIPLSGFLVTPSLDEQFFPAVEREQFHIELEFPADQAIGKTQIQVAQARELLRQHLQISEVHWFIGETGPKFYYNIYGERQNQPQYAEAIVQLTSGEGVTSLVQMVQRELDRTFPSARVLAEELGQGPPYKAPVEMRIYGPNLQRLRQLGREARAILAGISDVTHVRDDLSEHRPQLGLFVNESQARQAGLTNRAIAKQLEGYLEGAIGGSVLEAAERLPVQVQLTNAASADLSSIASLDLTASAGQSRSFRPLSALGEFELQPQLTKITRRNQQRVNTVQGFIRAGILPSTVLNRFRQALAENNFELPPNYHYEWGGEEAERNQAIGNLLLYVPLLVLGIIAALVLSLNSFRQAGILLLVAVGAVGMALLSLWLFNSLLGFMAIVGAMGLIGIAINDSIIVLSGFKEDQWAAQGNAQAMETVLVRYTRHIMATTVTTIMGFVPLLLDGDPFWRPLSIAIAGGIVGSSLLALYFVPAMYILMLRLSALPLARRFRSWNL